MSVWPPGGLSGNVGGYTSIVGEKGGAEGENPVSYRSFKHLLGETSLERKCRFIFGGGILVLVSISFYLYGLKTESLVNAQTNQTARILVDMTLNYTHNKARGGNPE